MTAEEEEAAPPFAPCAEEEAVKVRGPMPEGAHFCRLVAVEEEPEAEAGEEAEAEAERFK